MFTELRPLEVLTSDHQVDLVDRWEGSAPEDITTIDASLDEVSAACIQDV